MPARSLLLRRHAIARTPMLVMLLMPAVLAPSLRAQPAGESASKNWHQWRGPEANGVSRTANPPIEWGEGRNLKWKVALDGRGSSVPIIWNDRVFLLTAIDTGEVDPALPRPEDQPERVFGIKHPNTVHQFVVLCLDRDTGRELWRRTATRKIPHEGHHGDNDFASASPTTDGERLYCWFGAVGALHCYDLDGKQLWARDLGMVDVGASLGEGCSPVVHDGRVIIVRDNARQSYIEVLDAKTGQTVWRKDRDEPNAWATPRVVRHSGQTQIITAASNLIRSYDLSDGETIWQCRGLTGNVIPAPVVEGDMVYCMSGYKGYALLALPLSARGDISDSEQIAWSKDRGTPYIPSPVLYDGMLYFLQSRHPILSCLDARTGDTILDRTRLEGVSEVYASPVGADGRIYITARDGTTLVLERAAELKVLAINKLDDRIDASAALAGNQLFLRGRRYLYCLAEPSPALRSSAAGRSPSSDDPRNTGSTGLDAVFSANPIWSGGTSSSGGDGIARFIDADGDGDLDFVTCAPHPRRWVLYRNTGGRLAARPFWESAETTDCDHIDVLDFDADGAADLAARTNHAVRCISTSRAASTRVYLFENQVR